MISSFRDSYEGTLPVNVVTATVFNSRWVSWYTNVQICFFGLIVGSIPCNADQADETTPSPDGEKPTLTVENGNSIVEEIVVEGERIDPFELTPTDFERVYSDRRSGTYYFNIGDYEKAYPLLLVAAKNGFKGAQARVGFILIHGLGNVPKSNIRGVGWLGVASDGETAPTYRNYFRKLWKEIPPEHLPMMTEVVDKYRAKFGSDELQVSCDLRSPTKSHIRQLYCSFEREYDYQNVLDWENIMSAITNGTGFSSSITP